MGDPPKLISRHTFIGGRTLHVLSFRDLPYIIFYFFINLCQGTYQGRADPSLTPPRPLLWGSPIHLFVKFVSQRALEELELSLAGLSTFNPITPTFELRNHRQYTRWRGRTIFQHTTLEFLKINPKLPQEGLRTKISVSFLPSFRLINPFKMIRVEGTPQLFSERRLQQTF